jgi:putative addiction module component (TIGR02574 family)
MRGFWNRDIGHGFLTTDYTDDTDFTNPIRAIREIRIEAPFAEANANIEMPHRIDYAHLMSFAEIIQEIPNLSFAQRQELVRHAIAPDDNDLTPEENALLDARMQDFQRDPGAGIPLEQLPEHIAQRLSRR